MRGTSIKHLAVLSLLALAPSLAAAVGLGRLNVMSGLGQRLHAEIELLSVPRQDAGSLIARLGSSRAYEQANLPMGAAGSTGVRVMVERRRDGTPFILVTSGQPIYEPFINLLIELSSPAGQITREYSVLLDPPEIPPSKPVAAAAPTPTPPAATATPAPPTPAPVAKATETPAEYGPVQRGETLSGIAARVRPQGATLQQTMMGIFRANPSAFINNNINLLRAGHKLRLPDGAQLSSLAQSEATREVQSQTAAWSASRRSAAESAPPAAPPKPADPAAPTAARGATESGKHVVKLSRSDPAGKGRSTEDRLRMLEEELIAREKALNDANERIRKLEQAVMQGQGAAPAATPAPAKK